MQIDPWILAFSAVTVIVTIWVGFWSAKKSKTASDFFVAGRSVSVGWNASAISGEYLSAASFMGIAGMVMSSGYDALWYPVCYACGYLFLLLFIAGPLRRFGAYTIPDFAEGRFDSPLFRKIAVCFVLFIGFFYTMPQMKGAGTTLAYMFPGLPYWAGVVLVGAVITLNVALGGMKGITLVQAFQYWAKLFAISVPIFVLMAVYGHYGKQLELNNAPHQLPFATAGEMAAKMGLKVHRYPKLYEFGFRSVISPDAYTLILGKKFREGSGRKGVDELCSLYAGYANRDVTLLFEGAEIELGRMTSEFLQPRYSTPFDSKEYRNRRAAAAAIKAALKAEGVIMVSIGSEVVVVSEPRLNGMIRESSSPKQEYLSTTNRFRGAGIFLTGAPKRMVKEYEELLEKSPGSLTVQPDLAKIKMSFEELSIADLTCEAGIAVALLTKYDRRDVWICQTRSAHLPEKFEFRSDGGRNPNLPIDWFRAGFEKGGFSFIESTNDLIIVPTSDYPKFKSLYEKFGLTGLRCHQLVQTSEGVLGLIEIDARREVAANFSLLDRLKFSWQKLKFKIRIGDPGVTATPFAIMAEEILSRISESSGDRLLVAYELLESQNPDRNYGIWVQFPGSISNKEWAKAAEESLARNGIVTSDGAVPIRTNRCILISGASRTRFVLPAGRVETYASSGLLKQSGRQALPEKAPADSTWLSPFGPLTTKAAKAGIASEPASQQLKLLETNRFIVFRPTSWDVGSRPSPFQLALRPLNELVRRVQGQTYSATGVATLGAAMRSYTEFSQRQIFFEKSLTNISFQSVNLTAKSRDQLLRDFEALAATNGVALLRGPTNSVWAVRLADAARVSAALRTLEIKARPIRSYALLYTYSLIIALVCGTAGLPHILVRFYTNPDGVAAKRTTMWVMILIGIFYVFPPVFGVMGRNLLPELYAGVGAKGTDKIVLELPRILNERSEGSYEGREEDDGKTRFSSSSPSQPSRASRDPGIPWGSILSGITCAGAFAAFMSTFSGLLVSMTGAMAHDVYGRMLRPKATPEQRLRAFKIAAVCIGAVAILLGMQVEPLQINFMVGQAFAIAAASYFPLLFMCAWWRGMTMKGAATGMLTGGLLALAGISLTSFSDLKWINLADFWAAHPLLRILCEQPAIWTVPLAITLMIVVSKLTRKEIPPDVRMKMLVLHAPEKLGLKQEYIQEHQHGH